MAPEKLPFRKVKELSIPIPYGFIAAKAWGTENGIPILALHGWQDNAGTFDMLIPLLSPSVFVVAVDIVGHGLSSHKPKGDFYSLMQMLFDIKRVIDHLEWDKFSIIGHSWGGILGLMYGSVFPETVKSIILLDIVKPPSANAFELPQITQNAINEHLALEQKCNKAPPVHSYDEAKSRLIRNIFGSLTNESAEVLLKRGLKTSSCGKGVVFSRDVRLKVSQDLQKFSHEDMKAYMRNIKCNLLIILSKSSINSKILSPEIVKEYFQIYKDSCRVFQSVVVEGDHFVHLNHPEHVAPHINNFLGYPNSSKL